MKYEDIAHSTLLKKYITLQLQYVRNFSKRAKCQIQILDRRGIKKIEKKTLSGLANTDEI